MSPSDAEGDGEGCGPGSLPPSPAAADALVSPQSDQPQSTPVLQPSASQHSFASSCTASAAFAAGKYKQETCDICLERYTTSNPAMQFVCGHVFHFQCAMMWEQRSRNCPKCWAPMQQVGLFTGPESNEAEAAPEPEPAETRKRVSPDPRPRSPDEEEDDCSDPSAALLTRQRPRRHGRRHRRLSRQQSGVEIQLQQRRVERQPAQLSPAGRSTPELSAGGSSLPEAEGECSAPSTAEVSAPCVPVRLVLRRLLACCPRRRREAAVSP
eukprot:TRINITY_DN3232_c1_g1_i3.p2 TRINITY_DN3232_c1_g1~~TRINITY_DN3232_c1_g1_i3.p2  ORF type:complete len:268 (+),score=97.19 TRINITY_DN3232_c1_g1_i3:178-981(+)